MFKCHSNLSFMPSVSLHNFRSSGVSGSPLKIKVNFSGMETCTCSSLPSPKILQGVCLLNKHELQLIYFCV